MHTDGPPRNPEDTPEHRVSTYLKRNDQIEVTQVTRLHGDASSRTYFRIRRRRAHPIVLVVHPGPFAPETLPQLTVGTVFTRLGITIPTVLDHAGDLGVLAVEDLGDETLQDWLAASGEDPTPLYREAINIIATLQRCGKTLDTETGPPFDTAFDVSKLHWELAFFQSEFLGAHRRVILNNTTATALDREFQLIAEELAAEPRVLCHRDYHSRNLMVRDGRLVVIDFQDARMGPATYDLVSLLRDCYVDLDPTLVTTILAAFLTTVPAAHTSDFQRRFDLMSVQRHLKALGTFGHQITVADRPEFAPSLLRALGYLRQTLHEYARFSRLLELLSPHVPELTR